VCSAYIIILDLITFVIFGENASYGLLIMHFPQYPVICSFCDQIFSEPVLKYSL
jgi:hypothetical protein